MNGNFPSGNLRESDESFFKTSTWKTQKTRLKLIRSISSENLPQLRRTLCRIWRFLDRHFSSPKLRLSITVNHIDSQTWLKVFLLNAEEAKNHSILASDFKRKRGPLRQKKETPSQATTFSRSNWLFRYRLTWLIALDFTLTQQNSTDRLSNWSKFPNTRNL